VTDFTWAPDSTRLFFTVEDRGRQVLQMVPVTGGGARTIVSAASTVDEVRVTPDGKTLVYTQQTGSRPNEIFAAQGGGSERPLTHFNDALLAECQLPALEEFWVEAADQARIHSFLIKPPGFQPDHKYPVLFLIHGGPQGAWARAGPIAGTPRSSPRPGSWWSCPTRAAPRDMARSSSTRSTATGR